MTLSNIPFVVDGALTSSALLRKAIYAAVNSDGVVAEDDLLVAASSPAGQSLTVAAGAAVVLNRYQSEPNEVYVVSNPGVHNVTSGDMPGSSGSTTYWMVALVVGDPQAGYSQTGHPFMPSDFDEGQANTYQYARIVVLPCASTDDDFADLGVAYPGLALARIALPASTTTVTSGMITDLRKPSRGKQQPSGGITYASKAYAGTDWQRFNTTTSWDSDFPAVDGMTSAGGGLIVPTTGIYQVDGWVSFGTGSAGTVARRVVGASKSSVSAPSVPNYEHEFCASAAGGVTRFSGQIKMTAGEALYLWYYTDVANHYGASTAGLRATLIR